MHRQWDATSSCMCRIKCSIREPILARFCPPTTELQSPSGLSMLSTPFTISFGVQKYSMVDITTSVD
ncbi:hypothetical protein FH972_008130 [Carpinus fangiana]|uniref:Uncharacterized protein n=1 Tax=Carpinus fangiana TaxID=176857 RepID=A0A5N6R021_9ROSI|nr:hypothetical protein FH972_008130 [Carpinus fangiana]